MNSRLAVTIVVFALLAIQSSWSEPSEPKPTEQISAIKRILPKGWSIAAQHAGAVPTGLVNKTTGYYLTLQGPHRLFVTEETNGVPQTLPANFEHIEIWIMPADFKPKKPDFFQKGWPMAIIPDYTASEALNPKFTLFVTYSQTSSWPDWGFQVYNALKVIPVGYRELFKPENWRTGFGREQR